MPEVGRKLRKQGYEEEKRVGSTAAAILADFKDHKTLIFGTCYSTYCGL